jgi:hypothetical protein
MRQTCFRHLVTRFGAGSVVDRLGAGQILPIGLLPMAAGLVLLALADGSPSPGRCAFPRGRGRRPCRSAGSDPVFHAVTRPRW